MPLVRISYADQSGATDEYAISKGVHAALVSAFGIPEDDYFHILEPHPGGRGLVGPESFLGIKHGPSITFVQIAAAEGRSPEQKMTLFKQIAKNLEMCGLHRADIVINLIETKRENWSFGNGEAPFATVSANKV